MSRVFSLNKRFRVIGGAPAAKVQALTAIAGFLLIVAYDAPIAYAHSGEPPRDCVLVKDLPYGASCFEWNGDDQWVFDNDPNGWRVGVQIQTSYGKTRWCANAHGAFTWHECKFDHLESACVRFRMYEQNGSPTGPTRTWTGWSSWYSISTGEPVFGCTASQQPPPGEN